MTTKYDRSFLYILLVVCGGKKGSNIYTWTFHRTQRNMGSVNPGSYAYEHWKFIFVIIMYMFWSRNVNRNTEAKQEQRYRVFTEHREGYRKF